MIKSKKSISSIIKNNFYFFFSFNNKKYININEKSHHTKVIKKNILVLKYNISDKRSMYIYLYV